MPSGLKDRLIHPGILLTFEATLVSDARIKMSGLVPCDLPSGGQDRVRQIFLTREINDVISGRTQSNPAFPSDEADLVLGRYTAGLIFGVSRSHKGRGDFKWLQNIDETWVLAFRNPAPGWRLFGRFAKKNVFVGLLLVSREEAGDAVQYADCARKMHTAWKDHFPDCDPLLSTEIEAYLGEMWTER